MNRIASKIGPILLLSVLLINLASSAAPETLNRQPDYDCSNKTLPLEIMISDLNQTVTNLTSEVSYYQNLSLFYKEAYENKGANITNRELIQLYNTMNFNFNQTNTNITNLSSEFTKYKFNIGLSAFGGSLVGFTIFEVILWYFVRRKKDDQSSE